MSNPYTSRNLTRLVLVGCLAFASGCATHRPRSGGRADTHTELSDSSVDIAYVLGHSHRRLVAWARGQSYGGETLLEHQVLHEGGIDRDHYSEFLAKVEQFVNTPLRKPADQNLAAVGQPIQPQPLPSTAVAEDDSCRTPFTVTLRVGSDTKTLQGCRGEDDGALSHLVRDGEFLLYK